MRRSIPALVVLLLGSLLGNVLLAIRMSRLSQPASVSPREAALPERSARALDLEAASASLAAERKKNQELLSRIDQLEADKKVLAHAVTPASAQSEKLAAFREKLRKLRKMLADPAFKNGAGVDPDKMVELTDTVMEFVRMSALRAKEPKLYGEYLQAYYETSLEGEGTSLSADQAAQLKALMDGYGEDLAQIPLAPAGERLLKEIELEGALTGRVQALLSDAQRSALAKENMTGFSSASMLSTSFVTKQGAVDQIAQQWSSLYQLDASQLEQAKFAAQSFVDAMARIDAQTKVGESLLTKPGSPEAYDYRVQSIRQQLAALNMLQASMTTAQAELLRTQSMKEIRIFDASSQVQVVTPEK